MTPTNLFLTGAFIGLGYAGTAWHLQRQLTALCEADLECIDRAGQAALAWPWLVVVDVFKNGAGVEV
jgi:hypothetical protein